MSKNIISAISSVMPAAANSPPLVLVFTAGAVILAVGYSLAYRLGKQGKSVQFDIEGVMKFKAEFYPPS